MCRSGCCLSGGIDSSSIAALVSNPHAAVEDLFGGLRARACLQRTAVRQRDRRPAQNPALRTSGGLGDLSRCDPDVRLPHGRAGRRQCGHPAVPDLEGRGRARQGAAFRRRRRRTVCRLPHLWVHAVDRAVPPHSRCRAESHAGSAHPHDGALDENREVSLSFRQTVGEPLHEYASVRSQTARASLH